MKIAFFATGPQEAEALKPIYYEAFRRGHDAEFYSASAMFTYKAQSFKPPLRDYDVIVVNFEGEYLKRIIENKGKAKVAWTRHGLSLMKGGTCECIKADIILANAKDTWFTCFPWEHPHHNFKETPKHPCVKLVGYPKSDPLIAFRGKRKSEKPVIFFGASTSKLYSTLIEKLLKTAKTHPEWTFLVLSLIHI